MGNEFTSIPGYERYMINKHRIVKRAAHSLRWLNRWGQLVWRYKKERVVKPRISNKGYLRIALCEPDRKDYSVHRLVMITFKQNTFNLPEINHKDGNKLNNHVDNLEWCDKSHNQQHAFITGLNIPAKGFDDTQSKPVKLFFEGKLIWVFGSIGEAGRITKIKRATISKNCKSNKPLTGCSDVGKGCKFEYYEG